MKTRVWYYCARAIAVFFFFFFFLYLYYLFFLLFGGALRPQKPQGLLGTKKNMWRTRNHTKA